MKILFYDGDVRQWCRPATIRHYHTLDAARGPSDNIEQLEWAHINYYDCILLTNSLVALNHKYGWNKEDGCTDIYFYVALKRDFVRCDKLTDREIREEDNIIKMFMNGVFDLE